MTQHHHPSGAAEPAAARFTEETIVARRQWAPKLFSFRTTRHRGFRFAPGQFARIGLKDGDGKPFWRAYSIVSAPYDEHLEFYSIVVPDGAFSPRLADLHEGDRVLIEKTNYGFLTADRFAPGRDLWMLATGTGLAPFLSILTDPQPWQDFENLVLVHSVRHADELAYQQEIAGLSEHPLVGEHASRLRYVPVVTRESVPGALRERITTQIENGELLRHTGLCFSEEHSRFMVCGNPAMVEDTRRLLQARGFRVSRRNNPGHMVFENTW
jgi:ferredoxin--NADP+ reductase